jgi:hypothetical protein
MRGWFAALVIVPALALTACGDSTSRARTATPSWTASAAVVTRTPAPATPTPTGDAATTARAGSPTTVPVTESGIEGTVTIGPTCPVQRIDSPCPDRPYEATIVVLDSGRHLVAEARSDAQGTFRVPLPPGTYTLSPQSLAALPYAAEQTVTVSPGRFASVHIQFDSGIR